MKEIRILSWYVNAPTVCICGYSFGYCTAFWCPQERRGFFEAKQAHIREFHPRAWANRSLI